MRTVGVDVNGDLHFCLDSKKIYSVSGNKVAIILIFESHSADNSVYFLIRGVLDISSLH